MYGSKNVPTVEFSKHTKYSAPLRLLSSGGLDFTIIHFGFKSQLCPSYWKCELWLTLNPLYVQFTLYSLYQRNWKSYPNQFSLSWTLQWWLISMQHAIIRWVIMLLSCDLMHHNIINIHDIVKVQQTKKRVWLRFETQRQGALLLILMNNFKTDE